MSTEKRQPTTSTVTTKDVRNDPARVVALATGGRVHIVDSKGRSVGTLSIPTDQRAMPET